MFIYIIWAEFGSFLFNLWYVVLIAGCSNLSNVRALLNSTVPLHYLTYDWTLPKPASITTPRWKMAGEMAEPGNHPRHLPRANRCWAACGAPLSLWGALWLDGGAFLVDGGAPTPLSYGKLLPLLQLPVLHMIRERPADEGTISGWQANSRSRKERSSAPSKVANKADRGSIPSWSSIKELVSGLEDELHLCIRVGAVRNQLV